MRNALFKQVFGAAALVLGLSVAGAQVAFADQFSTDADVLDTGINASDAGNAATSGGSAVTITGAIAIVQQGNGNNVTTFPVDVPLRVSSTDGSAAWAAITPSSVHLTGYSVYQDFEVSVAVPGGTPSGGYSFQVQGQPPQQVGIGPGATYGFSVVNPLKPPVLSLSGNIAGVEATSSNGAQVSFAATAADANGADSVTCTPGSGSTFALGTTTVNCSSTNAAGTSSGSFTVTVVDTTAPTISTPVVSGQQGTNGWFTGPVIVTFSCSDYFLASCSPASPVVLGSDGAGQGLTITAKDSSGNSATQTVSGINIDQTVPSNIAGTPDRGTDSNGWYNHGLNVGFKATFGPSSGSCTSGSYNGPDTGSASVATTCTSGAGLNAQGNFGPFQYDGTAPSNVTGAAARGADSNGWYNAPVGIGFSGTFSASGGNCTSTTYSAPNSATATQAGSCTSGAGLTTNGSFGPFEYDSAAPTVAIAAARPADSNGWYNQPVSFSFSDSTNPQVSGSSCDSAVNYSGPDSKTASVSGSCTSGAGLTGTNSNSFQYDATAPSNVAGAAARGADNNGWYNAPVGIGFTGTFSASGGNCTSTTYSTPNSTTATQAGSCTSGAGLTTNGSFGPFEYDSAAPTVAIVAARPADSNGWYNHAVSFSFSDATNPQVSGSSCDAAANYSGPDSATASVTGNCTSGAGLKGTSSNSFQYDGTKPVVTATPDRAANGAGWYNAPVTVTFSGSALSGIASCDPAAIYGGPDNASASVSGNCTSNAGNTNSGSLSLKYDATKPGLNPTITPNPVVLGGTATGNPNATDNLSGIASASCTAIGTGKLGPISTTCTATDNAGNTATATANGNVVGITLSNATSSGSNCSYSIKAGVPFSCTYTYSVSEDAAPDTGSVKAQFGTTGNPGIAGTASNGGESWNIVTAKPNNNNFVVTATGTAPKLTVVNGTISVTLGGMPKCSAGSAIQLIDGFSVGGTFAGQNFNTTKNSPVTLTCQA